MIFQANQILHKMLNTFAQNLSKHIASPHTMAGQRSSKDTTVFFMFIFVLIKQYQLFNQLHSVMLFTPTIVFIIYLENV